MPLDAAKLKAGQDLVCTITKVPRSEAKVSTLERLMRLDPSNKRALRRAQRLRSQREVVYNRGNRDWVSREKCARVVRVVSGATWTMPCNLELVDELLSLGDFVKVQAK
jgi:hypothetical protein